MDCCVYRVLRSGQPAVHSPAGRAAAGYRRPVSRPPDVPPEPAWLDSDALARLAAEERATVDDDAAERIRAEWATATLDDRLRASVGRTVDARLQGGHRTAGPVVDAGPGWVVLAVPTGTAVLRTAAVLTAEGLADPVQPAAGAVAGRLGVGYPLRRVLATRRPVRALLVDGSSLGGSPLRVLADALDVVRHPVDRRPQPPDPVATLPWAAVAVLVVV